MQVTCQKPSRVFRQTDPAQNALRGVLSSLNDTQIVDLENDLATFSRTGMLSSLLERLLVDADPTIRQVA